MEPSQSAALYDRARRIIPGGVNSPVRACLAVEADPVFIDHAQGAMIYDADGRGYIDYIGSWGPMILGHGHPAVVAAVQEALARGTSFGAPTEWEVRLAEKILAAFPAMDMVRMVNSGTEATMSAVRLARAATGRDLIVKFDGCYHGHADTLLVAAGSGVATLGIPGSPGVPKAVVENTLSLPYNDPGAFEELMGRHGDRIAGVIVEPVAGNMGLVRPREGFLPLLRERTERHGSVLIFDEVMTGFRVAFGGAQVLYGIAPDLTCLAKVIGGGLPVGAYGGRRELMEQIAPRGPVYQAGTLSGNPLAMAAGIATLDELAAPGFYDRLDRISERLAAGLRKAAAEAAIPLSVDRVGSMLGLFFTTGPVCDFEAAKTSDLERFKAYYREMRSRGIYLAPSQFEALFVSAAHDEALIDATVKAAARAFSRLSE